jgi:hypothetical protein
MTSVGYEHLRTKLGLTALPPWRPARVRPVTRIVETPNALEVPAGVAPGSDRPLEHILFALKHEGVDLQILAQALAHVTADELAAAVAAAPTSRFVRTAGYLWERLTGRELSAAPGVGGNYVDVFDPDKYVTGTRRRDARWRVDFNGLGTLRYCATVRRTPELAALIEADILGKTTEFLDGLGEAMQERALAWAYLHETEASYEIERERPPEDRARAFAALLRQAHEPRPLTEEYLVELQNAVVSNAFDRAAEYRGQQNWLRSEARGAAGVTYVPPSPELAAELMGELLAFANRPPQEADALVCASVISFGFVFIHPFMDGNGRLSRFLFHKALFQRGELAEGRLLPVSVAMKRNERDYLAALQSFSRPSRERWLVRFIDEGRFDFEFRGDDSLYRYWDATPAAEFSLRMAMQALQVDLHQETHYLAKYDAIKRAVEDRFDVQNNTLATLIHGALQNENVVSKNRRKQFTGQVNEDVFGLIEEIARDMDEPQTPEDDDREGVERER